MARNKSSKKPKEAQTIQTYKELEALISGFVKGHFSLLAIVGRPGLSKSYSIREAMGANPDKSCLLVKGRMTPIVFYENVYLYKDKPIILDDCDSLMSDKLCRNYVKNLTETDEYRRLDWKTRTIVEAPNYFYTKSPVCVITNEWSNSDPIYQALASRAEFIWFDPTWEEVYKETAKWFWDQEIFDYFYENMPFLKRPDLRLFIKAYRRKVAKLKNLPWEGIIDAHHLDPTSKEVAKLMRKKGNELEKIAEFVKKTGKSKNTWYRRKAELETFHPTNQFKRLVLKNSQPPKMLRPADGVMMDGSDDDDE